MDDCLNRVSDYDWYLCLDKGEIVGGLGIIDNDFHVRKDLRPNVCAVYTEEAYRNQGIAGTLLWMAAADMKSKGISPLYLLTDLSGFYERYGWEFYCLAQNEDSDEMSRLYIHR
jgi:N-acetylglutamate synthase-like GNAT family acetyltransferase